MRPDRRSFLKLLLASALAEAVDVEQLLWIPRAIITVPAYPSIGAINVATYLFWRNRALPESIRKELRVLYLDGKGEGLRTETESAELSGYICGGLPTML